MREPFCLLLATQLVVPRNYLVHVVLGQVFLVFLVQQHLLKLDLLHLHHIRYLHRPDRFLVRNQVKVFRLPLRHLAVPLRLAVIDS